MRNERFVEAQHKGDKRVWIKGSNGITCVKWLTSLSERTDITVLCDYEEGDMYPNEQRDKRLEAEAIARAEATAKAIMEKKAKEAAEAPVVIEQETAAAKAPPRKRPVKAKEE